MRRQARRLWLGEWQREDDAPASQPTADPEQADTFVISSADDEDAQGPVGPRHTVRRAAIVAAVAAACALVFVLLSGGRDKPVTADQPAAQAPQVQPQIPQGQIPQGPQGAPPQGFGGPDLTGPAAVRAAKAAVARFPGSVERVTGTATGGGYVVHVIQGDGNEVHVLVDPKFHVRGSDAGGGAPTVPGTSQ
jgi:hypothetical protein